VRTEDGAVEYEGRLRTGELARWMKLRGRCRVLLETCNEAFMVADLVAEGGHDVRVVPAAVVRQLGVGYRGVKNDVRDARVLSKSSVALGDELPRVHVPSLESRRRQQLLTQREGLVKARTQLVNGVKSHLRAELLQVGTGSTSAFPRRARELLADHEELLVMIEPTLEAIERLTASIQQLEQRVKERTKADPQVRLLKTMPGVGALTATAFVATVDDIGRFESAAQLASYFGLTPGENTTGGKQRFTGVTKAGKTQVRTLLIQAAWTLVRVAPPSALAQSYQQLVQRRPKQVAIVALARRMVCVLFAMMRDQLPFDPRPRPCTRTDELAQALRVEQRSTNAT
jgi:transposase